MLDKRFYAVTPLAAAVLADGRALRGEGQTVIAGVAAVDQAGPQDLCFVSDAKTAATRQPGLLVAPFGGAQAAVGARAWIEAAQPRALFSLLARRVAAPRVHEGAAAVHPSAELEEDVQLGPGVVIGQGAKIGARSRIGANAVIGPGVMIGRDTEIGPNCTIGFALIGDRVRVAAGTVVGEAGFGVASAEGRAIDVPHYGRVIIQDDVTLGANCTIDRGQFGDTILGEHAKLDNLCHVAHQAIIGRNAVIAAFGGVSGSTVVGDGVTMGGRVGIGDHRVLGPGAVLAAGSIVLQDVPEGQTWGGYPAKPHRKFLREVAWLARKAGTRHGGE